MNRSLRATILVALTTACTADGGGFDDDALAATLWDDLQGYEAWGSLPGWPDEPVESTHGGDFVRAAYLMRRGASKTDALMSVVLDRVSGLAATSRKPLARAMAA